jgi:hypothetical protein
VESRIHIDPQETWHVEVDTDAGGRVEVEDKTETVEIDVTDGFGRSLRVWLEPDEAIAIAGAMLRWAKAAIEGEA